MPKGPESEKLLGSWLHAYEEDSADALVFRPAGADLPLSRGRAGVTFEQGGTMRRLAPGADDKSEAAAGAWKISKSGVLELDASLFGIDGTRFSVRRSGQRLILKPSDKS